MRQKRQTCTWNTHLSLYTNPLNLQDGRDLWQSTCHPGLYQRWYHIGGDLWCEHIGHLAVWIARWSLGASIPATLWAYCDPWQRLTSAKSSYLADSLLPLLSGYFLIGINNVQYKGLHSLWLLSVIHTLLSLQSSFCLRLLTNWHKRSPLSMKLHLYPNSSCSSFHM